MESLSLEGTYNLYAMIELYNYETSQEDITSGLINPRKEFQNYAKILKQNLKMNVLI